MKKTSTFIFTLMIMLTAGLCFSQSQRMAFVEEVTQASCGPCAGANPGIQTLSNANSGDVIFLAYQVWWPGFDPMYNDNPEEVQERIGVYYDGNNSTTLGAPNVYLQGVGGNQSTTAYTQAWIDGVNADMSEFDMDISAAFEDGKLTVTGNATATMEAAGDLRLRLILTEKTISIADAPGGTNGETEYHHVFKKFLNGTDGTDLEDSWAVGDAYEINETYDLSQINIYSFAELEVIAIIQNDTDKFIHQAAKDSEVDITVNFNDNANAVGVEGLPLNICAGEQSISPVVTLQNTGNADLVSATITYDVNGGAASTYDWTGSIATLQKENVTLPAISFTSETQNIVNFEISNPNGVSDEEPADNASSSVAVPQSGKTAAFATVEIMTDNYGDEVYWEVRNSLDEVVMSGGNPNVGIENIGTGTFPPPASADSYANLTLYTIEVPVDAQDCYTFHMADYYGDGMTEGGGWFRLSDNWGNELVYGNETYAEVVNNYNGDITSDIEDLENVTLLNVYPNPATDFVTVDFDINTKSKVQFVLTDVLGKVVYNTTSTANGANSMNIETSNFKAGMYNLTMIVDGAQHSTKLTLVK